MSAVIYVCFHFEYNAHFDGVAPMDANVNVFDMIYVPDEVFIDEVDNEFNDPPLTFGARAEYSCWLSISPLSCPPHTLTEQQTTLSSLNENAPTLHIGPATQKSLLLEMKAPPALSLLNNYVCLW